MDSARRPGACRERVERQPKQAECVLLVHPDAALRGRLARMLASAGRMIHQACDAGAALAVAGQARPHVLLTALHLPGDVDGFALLHALRRGGMDLEAIVWAPAPGLEALSAARRLGVLEVIDGPLDAEAVERSVSDAFRVRRLRIEASRGSPPPHGDVEDRARLIGCSTSMRELKSQITDCAASEASVLIFGESGTGKELVAREIHRRSRRSGQPFVAVRFGALPPTLAESTLFGHVRGAFTDAQRDHRGYFEQAGSGTVFLDEIGDLPPELQPKLLAVLQERTFTRLGGETLRSTDARVIAATHRDLTRGVEEGWFREDLFYRLNVVVIRVPPLRARMDDLEELVAHLLARAAAKQGADAFPIVSPDAFERLRRHSWPGNVRELENCLLGALVRARRGVILPRDLQFVKPVGRRRDASPAGRAVVPPSPASSTPAPAKPGQPLPWVGPDGRVLTLEEVDREQIERVLRQVDGNVSHAARLLRKARSTLQSRMKALGVDGER